MTTPMRIWKAGDFMTQCLTTEHLVVFEADWDEREREAGLVRHRTYTAVLVEEGVWVFPVVTLTACISMLGGLGLEWVEMDPEDYRHVRVGAERAAALVDELVTALHGHVPGLAPSRSSPPRQLPEDNPTSVVWWFRPLGGRRADN
jgi:hypothetical protein